MAVRVGVAVGEGMTAVGTGAPPEEASSLPPAPSEPPDCPICRAPFPSIVEEILSWMVEMASPISPPIVLKPQKKMSTTSTIRTAAVMGTSQSRTDSKNSDMRVEKAVCSRSTSCGL